MFKKQVVKYWKENSHKYNINEHNGTWLHTVGFWVHLFGKATAFMPSIGQKHKPKKYKLRRGLAAQLEVKLHRYKLLIKKHQNKHGFIMHEHCDSLLYTGLFSVAANGIDISAARDDAGYWHRRNLEFSCYPNRSKSTISRDMMLGLYWYLWEHKDASLAESVLRHAKNNNYVIGLGDPARLLMMPGGEATLAEICHKLGGKNRWLTRHQKQSWSKGLKDYEIHLLVQHALLRGNVVGHINNSAFKALRHYANKNSHNPLYTYAHSVFSDGDMNHTVELLLQENLWPSDRLPTSHDRRSDWVISRDAGHDWEPHEDTWRNEEYSGADFITVAHQILRNL